MRGASTAGSNITIRFDDPTASAIPFKKGDNAELQFRTLYISNAAQAGRTLDILVTESSEAFRYELATEISTISLIDSLTTIVDPVNISDRAARLLGVVKSITDPVDISDRISRDLGVVDSITDPVTIAGEIGVDIVKSGNQFDEIGSDASEITDAAVNTIHVTTGDRPAGLYIIDVMGRPDGSTQDFQYQHRDSADVVKEKINNLFSNPRFTLVLNFALNDDFVVKNTIVQTGGNLAHWWIHWRRMKA